MLERYAKTNPLTVLMITVGLALLGFVSLLLIPVSLGHGAEYPGLTVEVSYSGVTPDKIEEIITRPIEDAVATVGGIEELFSVSEEGKTKVNIQFNQGANVNLKALEIRERVDIVASAFPRETQKPVIMRYDPDQRPVMIIILGSKEKDLSELREIADRQISKQLSGVQGVSQVSVAGGRNREVLVDCDRQKLQSYSLSMRDIFQTLQKVNLNVSAGSIEDGGGRFNVYAKGRYISVAQIKETALFSTRHHTLVRLGDVADVSYALREQDSASRVDGEERIGLYVYRASRANLLDISHGIYQILEGLSIPDVGLTIIYDQAQRVRQTLRTFLVFTVLGLILSGLVIRRFTHSGFLALQLIFIAMVAALTCVFSIFMLGRDLNLLSIAGLILTGGVALGFLGAITFRRPAATAYSGQSIRLVVAIGILLICATFLPVVFASREARLLYGGLATSIVFSIVPAFLLLLLLSPIIGEYAPRFSIRWVLVLRYVLPSFAGFSLFRNKFRNWGRVIRVYARNYNPTTISQVLFHWMIAFIRLADKRMNLFLVGYLVFLILGVVMLSGARQEFGNPLEEAEVRIHVEFPSGTSFSVTDSTTRKIEAKLKDGPGIKQTNAKVESSQATILVRLEEGQTADDAYIDLLRSRIGSAEPAFVYFASQMEGNALREVTVDCFGPDLDSLDKITRAIAKRTEALPGVHDVVLRYKSARPELQVVVDKLKAEKAGISSREVGEMLRYAIQGGVATKFIDQTRELDVRIRYKEIFRDNPDSINEISLSTQEKRFVPLKEVATLHENMVPVKVYRKNKKRVFSFSFRPKENDYASIEKLVSKLSENELPLNYRISISREFEKIVETRQQFYTVGISALVLIYMILASYFESLTKPIAILITLPIPIIVSGLFLRIFSIALTVPGLAGMLMVVAFAAIVTMRVLDYLDKPELTLEEQNLASLLLPFLFGAGIICSFFLPFLFASGEGRSLFIGITVVMLTGLPVACIVVPVAVCICARNPGPGDFLKNSLIKKGLKRFPAVGRLTNRVSSLLQRFKGRKSQGT